MFAAFALPAVSPDLTVNFGDFAATTVEFSAVTPKGREFLAAQFGQGACGVNIPKSHAPEFAAFAATCGVQAA